FPILHQVVSDNIFNDMVNDYFINHNSQTPQVWKLPEEIHQHAIETNWKEKYALPWLNDLILLEYMESKIFTMPDASSPNHVPLINYLDEPLAITSEFELIKLEYPVHIYPINQCIDKKDTFNVLIYRHPETHLVHFIDLNPIYAALISELYRTHLSVHQILSQSIDSNQSIDPTFLNSIHHFIEHLYQQQFILGRLVN
ncbi:MAG: DNA-binding domain-containing protein, partial [Bacteroidales bacterium]|nr:DNA-binding domain-containing protein [Bacteroidales bacterium]